MSRNESIFFALAAFRDSTTRYSNLRLLLGSGPIMSVAIADQGSWTTHCVIMPLD